MYFNDMDGEKQQQPIDRIVLLKSRISQLLQVSQDPAFTRYLMEMQNHVNSEEGRINQLRDNLEKQYRVYQQNMGRRNVPVQQTPVQPQAVQPNQVQTEAPAVQQATMEQMQTTSESLVNEQPNLQPEVTAAVTIQAEPSGKEQPVVQKSSRNAEFTIGAAVLSIVGSAFVLTAMVLLGMYFMEGLMKGMLLYVACAVVIVLAELLLYKRWPGLGTTFSAIGIAGLYISTMVNYLALGNFNAWVTLAITTVITLLMIAVSRKKDAAIYRVLGMTAMYLCYALILCGNTDAFNYTQTELVTMTVVSLIVNIVCITIPLKKSYTAVNITHMALNSVFAFGMWMYWHALGYVGNNIEAGMWQYPFFAVIAVIIMQMIFVVQLSWKEKQEPGAVIMQNIGIGICYGISAFLLACVVGDATVGTGLVGGDDVWAVEYRVAASVIMALLAGIPFVAVRNRREKWFSWYFLSFCILMIHSNAAEDLEFFAAVVVLLVGTKLLSFTKEKILCVNDLLITLLACLICVTAYDKWEAVPVFAGIVLSVLCINYWKTLFEILVTFTIATYTTQHMIPILKLPVYVGILFVGMLIFNNVKRWHGKFIVVLNACALVGQIVCYLFLVNPVYQNAYLTYLCMLIFGIAVIVICLQEQYHLACKFQELVLAIFLTYMGLIIRTNYPIVNSILLMLIALACVGIGFYNHKKSIRIYGLTLSLVICGKIVLYDFVGAHLLQKTILFFVVGIIALVIASIYMVLERKQEKKEQQVG